MLQVLENSEVDGKGESYRTKYSDNLNLHVYSEVLASKWMETSPEFFHAISSTFILHHLLKSGKCISGSEDTQKTLNRGHEFFFWGYFTMLNTNN